MPWCWDEPDQKQVYEALASDFEVPVVATQVLSKRVFPLKDGHWLLFRYASRKQVTLQVRLVYEDPDGNILEFVQDVDTDISGQIRVQQWPLSDGFLLSAVVSLVSGTAQVGEVFCDLSICILSDGNLYPVLVLFADYVSSFQNLSWGASRIALPDVTDGFVKSAYLGSLALPGVWSVDYRVRARVLSVEFYIGTSATVADRRVVFSFGGSVGIGHQYIMQTTQPASSVYYYRGVLGLSSEYTVSPGYSADVDVFFPLPEAFEAQKSLGMSFDLMNMQAGDGLADVTVDYLARVDIYA